MCVHIGLRMQHLGGLGCLFYPSMTPSCVIFIKKNTNEVPIGYFFVKMRNKSPQYVSNNEG